MMRRMADAVNFVLKSAALTMALVMGLAVGPRAPLRAQTNSASPAQTLKSILLAQLKSTHSKSEWFVCADVAVAGLTPEQASWKDGKGNHSVGQLAYHIWFWNRRNLAAIKGEKAENFSGNNDETFDNYDPKTWAETVKKMDAVFTELEQVVESADDAKLAKIATTIEHINAHNAYHIGEIVMVRKEAGNWDASKGVK
ncbi:MAG TPA: DinB family protein [Candidatus Acidoferrales bacterium]|nr:DinB family protein [Candidatus Acidoferrales bacterium]